MIRLKIEAFCREREREIGSQFTHTYYTIISVENLLIAWQEFLRGKRNRHDVSEFSPYFIDNILTLHDELLHKNYQHNRYQAFKINDPKPRDIHKASVRDRLVHHAIYRVLYPYVDRKFIFDSFSCRINKGTHRAINRFREYGRKVSRNNSRTVWVLKCDVKKFFASIDHETLKRILKKYIQDPDTLWLLGQVIDSFHAEGNISTGLPIGNLTSQLLVNVYMNEFDQFVKHDLKVRCYIRYADDWVILSENKSYLENLIPKISGFLKPQLRLSLHPDKVFIKTLASGVDFLGWVHFPHHRVLRTATKRRMIKRLRYTNTKETATSYLGMLKHGNTYKLAKRIM